MFPDLEFIKTCLNGLRSRIEKIEQVEKQIKNWVENWVTSFVRTNRSNWEQNDPNALDYVKGRTHYEDNGEVVKLPSKFLPSPTANTVGAIKADSAKTTDMQPVRLGADGKLYSSGIPIFTTSGTGSAYTANVPEINELVNGMLVVMIPHVKSASKKPTLNINGLGAYEIQRFLSSQTGAAITIAGIYSGWLKSGVPVILMYNSGRWFACNLAKPDVQDLFGKVSISNGGTGRSFLTKGSYLVGNDISQVLLKTPSEVLADIGAIPAPATAKVGQVIAVKAVDENGKPTEWEAVDMAAGDKYSPTLPLVASITLAEEASMIEISTDKDGNPLSLEELDIRMTLYGGASNVNRDSSIMYFNGTSTAIGRIYLGENIGATGKYLDSSQYFVKREYGSRLIGQYGYGNYKNNKSVVSVNMFTYIDIAEKNKTKKYPKYTQINLYPATDGYTFGAGTQIDIYGR